MSASALPADGLVQAAPARVASPWVVGPAFDGFFFLGSALAVVAAWIAHAVKVDPLYVMVFVGVASNGPHLSSTWTRVYLDAKELKAKPISILAVPVVVLAAILGMHVYGRAIAPSLETAGWRNVAHVLMHPGQFITSLILYWATWHFAAQCYGILRLYQRRSGEGVRATHRAESALIFAVAATGLLSRLHFGPRRVFGSDVLTFPIPRALVVAAFAAAAVAALVVVSEQVRRAFSNEGVAWTRMAFLAAVVCGFWVPFLLIEDGTTAFFAAACWHGFQYLGIVWHFNRRKFASRGPEGARLVWWVSQPGAKRVLAYAALLLALAGAGYVVIGAGALASGWGIPKMTGIVWPWLTLSHYWIDGVIWKMRRGDVAKTLQAA